MFFPADQPTVVDSLLEQYHPLAEALSSIIEWPGKTLNLLPGADLCHALAQGQIARVEGGIIHVNWKERTAFILQKGDFITHFNDYDEQALSYIVEESASVACINSDALNTQLASDQHALQQWHNLLLMQSAIFSNAYGASVKQGIRPAAGFQRYVAGDTIIKEGEPAEHVFTLLKGAATASVRSVPLGAINEGEIFGALAAITGEIRNATVKAQSNCTVMAVPKEQFLDLIKSQPETCLQMIQTMAYQITTLNNMVSSRVESTL
ncbi:Crp/Fnr family transcriptional regulator [Alkalimarinus sediminis]|uniref:Cyclic nucleotide-binding domain-containing protein n=1 Tax=Alkalimarinus sediminis TaxID=1632866 RepID=A0A9E8HMI0_9ALTE|nr:cyclic nucleotide-binding domain-containing protein [Alkalimarinus sediminis]UZW75363.1 cyclic nucleotide-binding domain-containing protein [Alkalimarinus sediminis]